eukprot:snap_masked-scaffold_37-processed-gene-2.37-mRNA-1 protein AED:1.00 eAED:1.00 QI:0/-1/0/0/-1/1/1/0/536
MNTTQKKVIKLIKLLLTFTSTTVAIRSLIIFIKWKRSELTLKKMKKNTDSIAYCSELTGSPVALMQNLKKNQEKMLDFRLELFEKYTENFSNKIKTFTTCGIIAKYKPILFTVDPEIVDHVFNKNVNSWFRGNIGFKLVFGKSIGSLNHGPFSNGDDELFKFQRKSGVKWLNKKFLEQKVTKVALEHFKKASIEIKNKSQNFPMKRQVQTLIFSLFVELAYGYKFEDPKETDYYFDAFMTMFDYLADYAKNPLWSLPLSKYYLSAKKGFYREKEKMNEFCYKVIDSKFEALRSQKGVTEEADLLTLFIKNGYEKGKMSRERLKDAVLTLLVAGIDTSAHVMQYIIYYLAKEPQLQNEMCQEISKFTTLDQSSGDILFDYEQLRSSRVLDSLILEVGRLHPPVPLIGRYSVNDDVLPDGTFVPKGTTVFCCQYSISRDERNYVDAKNFKPDRFVEGERKIEEVNEPVLPLFLLGKRRCLGKKLAMYELKLFACFLLRKYKFSLSEEEKSNVKCGGTLYGNSMFQNYKNDLLLNLEER